MYVDFAGYVYVFSRISAIRLTHAAVSLLSTRYALSADCGAMAIYVPLGTVIRIVIILGVLRSKVKNGGVARPVKLPCELPRSYCIHCLYPVSTHRQRWTAYRIPYLHVKKQNGIKITKRASWWNSRPYIWMIFTQDFKSSSFLTKLGYTKSRSPHFNHNLLSGAPLFSLWLSVHTFDGSFYEIFGSITCIVPMYTCTCMYTCRYSQISGPRDQKI